MIKSTNKSIAFFSGWRFKASIWNKTIQSFPHYFTQKIDLPLLKPNQTTLDMTTILSNQIINPSIIVAWSLGGLFAIHLCHNLPNQIKKLILVCSLPKFASDAHWIGIDSHLINQFRQHAEYGMNDLLLKFQRLVQHPNHSKLHSQYINDHKTNRSLMFYLNLLFELDYRDQLKTLSIPIHFIFGECDAVIPIQSMKQLESLNKNIVLHSIPDGTHIPFVTNENKFNQLLSSIFHEF